MMLELLLPRHVFRTQLLPENGNADTEINRSFSKAGAINHF